jgi:hypothetical protein
VVHLGIGGEAVVLQAFDHGVLPQWPVPVEQRAVQPRGQLQQLTHPALTGQRGEPDVILQIKVVIVGPGDLAEAAHRVHRPPAKQRPYVHFGQQRAVQLADVVRSGTLGQLEQLQTAHMHGPLPRLGKQEQRVRDRHDRQGSLQR